jgi:hypothetical protein
MFTHVHNLQFSFLTGQILLGKFPVNQMIQIGFDIVCPAVLIIYIVGMTASLGTAFAGHGFGLKNYSRNNQG